MNERNQELIVDLLGGLLSSDEESAALTRIEQDPDLRAEYEAQMSAISILGTAASPMMTADERTALHATLRQQLHLDEAPVPVAAGPSRWQRWLAPLGGLAVAAVVVFGAVVILPDVLSGTETFEAASAEITTTAASASVTDSLADGDGGAGASAPEALEAAPAGEDSVDTETQAAETYDVAGVNAELPYLPVLDLKSLENDLSSDPNALRSGTPPPSSKSGDVDAGQVGTCLELLRVANPSSEISPIALTTYEGTDSVVISVAPFDGDPFLAVYGVASCEELATTQG
jgi:hypothetical protein